MSDGAVLSTEQPPCAALMSAQVENDGRISQYMKVKLSVSASSVGESGLREVSVRVGPCCRRWGTGGDTGRSVMIRASMSCSEAVHRLFWSSIHAVIQLVCTDSKRGHAGDLGGTGAAGGSDWGRVGAFLGSFI